MNNVAVGPGFIPTGINSVERTARLAAWMINLRFRLLPADEATAQLELDAEAGAVVVGVGAAFSKDKMLDSDDLGAASGKVCAGQSGGFCNFIKRGLSYN